MGSGGKKEDGRGPGIDIRISVEEVVDGKDAGRISRLRLLTRVWLALYLLSVLLFCVGLRVAAYSFCAGCAVAYVVSLFFYARYAFFVPDILRDGYGDGRVFERRRRMNVAWWKLALAASLASMLAFALLRVETAAGVSMLAAVMSFFVLAVSIVRPR